MLVHPVNVTEVDVSAEIELWQKSVSHDIRLYTFVYIILLIYILNNIIYFVFVKSCFIILVADILIYYYRYVVILLNFMLSFETVLF